MKKIAVLTDIHGNYLLLKEILNSLKTFSISDYIFCGDNITDGFENNKVLNLIKSKTENIIAGNREVDIANYDGYSWENFNQWKPMRYVYNSLSKENKNFISYLPIFKIIEIEGKRICISHGTPENVREPVKKDSFEIFDKLIKRYPCDIYLFGHTHNPFYLKYRNCIFINSGSVNMPVNGEPKSTYGILTVEKEKINYIQKGIFYDLKKIKDYYKNSNYHKECIEWSNLIIYTLQYGNFDYTVDFAKFVNKSSGGKQERTSKLWGKKFKEYMKAKNLKIFD